ncbi:hypothetical protein B0I35DRAFT_223406 [Stachybotrys elegans]|uniref:Uncharacterized protein n=1 Tax=Stachybotrys elegans TaxID=80388 RepID=A0A8K0SXT5_9HYPO|nr:hypothetical protein B0I35DRAFT_223406 [Stachybotrys elegans]
MKIAEYSPQMESLYSPGHCVIPQHSTNLPTRPKKPRQRTQSEPSPRNGDVGYQECNSILLTPSHHHSNETPASVTQGGIRKTMDARQPPSSKAISQSCHESSIVRTQSLFDLEPPIRNQDLVLSEAQNDAAETSSTDVEYLGACVRKEPISPSLPRKRHQPLPPHSDRRVQKRGRYIFRVGVRISDYKVIRSTGHSPPPASSQFQCRDGFD